MTKTHGCSSLDCKSSLGHQQYNYYISITDKKYKAIKDINHEKVKSLVQVSPLS